MANFLAPSKGLRSIVCTMNKRLIFAAVGVLALALSAWAEIGQSPEPAAGATDAPPAPLIVIDPGHGGGNTGAPGIADAVREKHVTLPLSRTLAKQLRGLGYRVVLTRERDEYLTLRQRVAFANRAGADLFLSVHANATPTHAQRGYETYVLSVRGIDVDGRALRLGQARERPGVAPDVAAILDDVERGFAQEPAASLAAAIQERLGEVWDPADNRGVKQDSMHVLLGANMPAVLVEVGFVDHAIEGRALLAPDTQIRIAGALTEAVRSTMPPSRVARALDSR